MRRLAKRRTKKARENIDQYLLGRPTHIAPLDQDYICGKTVLVTGAGSIGSHLCKALLSYHPSRVVILDIYENNAYDLQQDIAMSGDSTPVDIEILSITDQCGVEQLFKKYRPSIVFHTAAHKHVPLMEHNPVEAVQNNIFGTLNLVNASMRYDVQKFVLISTDKAVNPTNVMGATKRCCEKIIQMASRKGSNTEFCAVRFGNVLGANGSVIPLFERQIERGGPVTVTHRDIIRYFMTIPEAVSLVLQAGAYANGGEIFVLDMGEQVNIVKLAENLIRAKGYEPYRDIEIVFTGLRPGEKLYEELLMKEEGLKKTDNNKIYIGQQIEFEDADFSAQLDKMRDICASADEVKVLDQLKVLVPTFTRERVDADKESL